MNENRIIYSLSVEDVLDLMEENNVRINLSEDAVTWLYNQKLTLHLDGSTGNKVTLGEIPGMLTVPSPIGPMEVPATRVHASNGTISVEMLDHNGKWFSMHQPVDQCRVEIVRLKAQALGLPPESEVT